MLWTTEIITTQIPLTSINVPEAAAGVCFCPDWVEPPELELRLCVVEADGTDVEEGRRVQFGFEVVGAEKHEKTQSDPDSDRFTMMKICSSEYDCQSEHVGLFEPSAAVSEQFIQRLSGETHQLQL